MASFPVLSVLGLIFSVLISSGALLFFFRYGIRLALVEETLRQNSLPAIAAKLVVMETAMAEMKQKMVKLDKLDGIETKVELMLSHLKAESRQQP